jgi:hypothetical protein
MPRHRYTSNSGVKLVRWRIRGTGDGGEVIQDVGVRLKRGSFIFLVDLVLET